MRSSMILLGAGENIYLINDPARQPGPGARASPRRLSFLICALRSRAKAVICHPLSSGGSALGPAAPLGLLRRPPPSPGCQSHGGPRPRSRAHVATTLPRCQQGLSPAPRPAPQQSGPPHLGCAIVLVIGKPACQGNSGLPRVHKAGSQSQDRAARV